MNFTKVLLRYRRPLIILTHFFMFVGAYVLAFMLRFDFYIPLNERVDFFRGLPVAVGIQMLVAGAFGQFRGLWQYVSMADLVQILKANVVSSVLFVAALWTFVGHSFPRTVFVLDLILAFGMTCSVRLTFKLLREVIRRRNASAGKHRILIIGAGQAGARLLRELLHKPDAGEVVGFIDDSPQKLHETIHNVPILGNRNDIPAIAERYKVDEIILAIPSATGSMVRNILAKCAGIKARIRVVPSWDKVMSGDMVVKPRDVQPDDLLGRETVVINNREVQEYIKGRTVLVTGAGGSIGSEICRQVASYAPACIILFDHHENFLYFLSIEIKARYPSLEVRTEIGDVRDVGLLKHVFSTWRPQVVFHAAAHKHVPLMEDSPVAAVKNNVFGSRNIIYACHHYKVERMVQISTDKAVNPVNVMGMSKRVAEIILQARARRSRTKFMAVRFGNVLGSAGSVVPLFNKQIKYGGPLTVTHPEVKRYFMSIKEAVMLVLQAGAIGRGSEIFILDMGEQIKVVDIARNLVSLSGLTPGKDIQIEFTGLRPGEKLEEEILLDKEKDGVTKHDKIFVSRRSPTLDAGALHQKIKAMHRSAELMDAGGIMRAMNDIIALAEADHNADGGDLPRIVPVPDGAAEPLTVYNRIGTLSK